MFRWRWGGNHGARVADAAVDELVKSMPQRMVTNQLSAFGIMKRM